jgi:hypothetical protein
MGSSDTTSRDEPPKHGCSGCVSNSMACRIIARSMWTWPRIKHGKIKALKFGVLGAVALTCLSSFLVQGCQTTIKSKIKSLYRLLCFLNSMSFLAAATVLEADEIPWNPTTEANMTQVLLLLQLLPP